MSNNFEITCPKCKASFNAEEAFKQHFQKEKEKEIARIKTEEDTTSSSRIFIKIICQEVT